MHEFDLTAVSEIREFDLSQNMTSCIKVCCKNIYMQAFPLEKCMNLIKEREILHNSLPARFHIFFVVFSGKNAHVWFDYTAKFVNLITEHDILHNSLPDFIFASFSSSWKKLEFDYWLLVCQISYLQAFPLEKCMTLITERDVLCNSLPYFIFVSFSSRNNAWIWLIWLQQNSWIWSQNVMSCITVCQISCLQAFPLEKCKCEILHSILQEFMFACFFSRKMHMNLITECEILHDILQDFILFQMLGVKTHAQHSARFHIVSDNDIIKKQ